MSSRGIVDLRSGKRERRPPEGQQPLFAARSPRSPKRPMPLRARRRRIRAAIAFFVLAILTLLVYGISFVSYLPQFSIQNVVVTGAQDVPPQLIGDYVQTILDNGSYHFLSRDNIFLYPRAVLEKDTVGFFPRISAASVSRPSLFSTTLNVSVTERQQYAFWCDTDAVCYEMDGGGFIFAQASSTSATSTQYVFEGGVSTSTSPIGQSFVPAHLPGIVALLTELAQSGFTPQGASVQSDEDFYVPLAAGFELKASFGENADELVKNLQLVLSSDVLQGKENQLEYIDLRFGDRVYYKLQGEAEASSTPQ